MVPRIRTSAPVHCRYSGEFVLIGRSTVTYLSRRQLTMPCSRVKRELQEKFVMTQVKDFLLMAIEMKNNSYHLLQRYLGDQMNIGCHPTLVVVEVHEIVSGCANIALNN
ncbi:hypothetical protein KC19_VG086900 [Ceratodon purpureus]|uniref:Uncharacterized protein n=1 Tax=Ceratodon purpureus TaxID=3225 RepID=A0A8T0HNW1_CERPU|nr:hypothetical protein KC19_VG086900 [Ceratodon purpureus]